MFTHFTKQIIAMVFFLIFAINGNSYALESLEDYYIVFSSNLAGSNTDLFWITPDGLNADVITNVMRDFQVRDARSAACFSNLESVLFPASLGLHRIDLDGENLTTLLDFGFYDNPDVSPDNTKIAFNALLDNNPNQSDHDEIYVSNVDGSNLNRLTNNSNFNTEPSWSPDGQKIAYITLTPDGDLSGITIINNDGSNPTQVTQNASYEADVAWSPDGQKLAFSSTRSGTFHIYTISIDGSNLVQLTTGSSNNLNPQWSPDGEYISFSSDRDAEGYQIYVMDADGGNQNRITPEVFSNADNYNQCWITPQQSTPTPTPIPISVNLATIPATVTFNENSTQWQYYTVSLSEAPIPQQGSTHVGVTIEFDELSPSGIMAWIQKQNPGGSFGAGSLVLDQSNWQTGVQIRIRARNNVIDTTGDVGRVMHRIITGDNMATNYTVNVTDSQTGERISGTEWNGGNDANAPVGSGNVIVFTVIDNDG